MDLIIWNNFNSLTLQENKKLNRLVRPLGPHQLAAYLQKFGYKVKIIDFSNLIVTDSLIEITEKYIMSNTIAIGFSNTFTDLTKMYFEPDWVLQARSKLENKYPNLDWITGGSKNIENKFLKKTWKIFQSYAENSLLKYLDEKTKNKSVRATFEICSLDFQYLNNLGIQKSEVLPFELSRGCQFKCTFCSFPLLGKKKNTYIRNYNYIETELKELYYRYGTTRFYFIDDTVNESEEKVQNLADIASRLPFKLEWVGYLRADLIGKKPYTATLLKNSGLVGAYFGIETFNPYASKQIRKNWNGIYAKDFLLNLKNNIWKNDIIIQCAMIVGLTGESEQSINDSHQWFIDNNMDSWMFSSLFIQKSNKNNLYISELDKNYENYGYTFPYEDKNYFWQNDNWDFQKAVQKTNDLMHDINFKLNTKLGPWYMSEIASLGFDFNQIKNTYRKDIDHNVINKIVELRIKEYIDWEKNYAI